MIRKPMRERDTAAAISGVDQRLRDCLQVLWLALPTDKQNIEDLENHYKRLVDRALGDFREDLELFPPEEKF